MKLFFALLLFASSFACFGAPVAPVDDRYLKVAPTLERVLGRNPQDNQTNVLVYGRSVEGDDSPFMIRWHKDDLTPTNDLVFRPTWPGAPLGTWQVTAFLFGTGTNNGSFITNILGDTNFITNLGDTLAGDTNFITNLGDNLAGDTNFTQNIAGDIITIINGDTNFLPSSITNYYATNFFPTFLTIVTNNSFSNVFGSNGTNFLFIIRPTIADMKNVQTDISVQGVFVEGFAAPGDQGGGLFAWRAGDARIEDGIMVFISNVGPAPGVWERIPPARFLGVNVAWAGGAPCTNYMWYVALAYVTNNGSSSPIVWPMGANEINTDTDSLYIPDNITVTAEDGNFIVGTTNPIFRIVGKTNIAIYGVGFQNTGVSVEGSTNIIFRACKFVNQSVGDIVFTNIGGVNLNTEIELYANFWDTGPVGVNSLNVQVDRYFRIDQDAEVFARGVAVGVNTLDFWGGPLNNGEALISYRDATAGDPEQNIINLGLKRSADGGFNGFEVDLIPSGVQMVLQAAKPGGGGAGGFDIIAETNAVYMTIYGTNGIGSIIFAPNALEGTTLRAVGTIGSAVFIPDTNVIFSVENLVTNKVQVMGNGVIKQRESAAPTASANFGQWYSSVADNHPHFVSDNGTDYDLTVGSGAAAAGNNTEVQFKSGGVFAASTNFTYASSALSLRLDSAAANPIIFIAKNLDTAAVAAGSTLAFNVADTGGTELLAAKIQGGKAGSWTPTASTRDGSLEFSVDVDDVSTTHLSIAGTAVSIQPSIYLSVNGPLLMTGVTAVKTSLYTLLLNDHLGLADTSGGGFTMNLYATPAHGQRCWVKKTTTDANTLTVAGNGHNIDGAASVTTALTTKPCLAFWYNGNSGEWVQTNIQ